MPKKSVREGSTTAQSARFVEAAREAGCSEDEAVFDANMKAIVKVKAERLKKGPKPPKLTFK